jgi:hypothetical protein
MFEQACEHGKGWRVAYLSVKKESDGGVHSTACGRLSNEKLRKYFSHGTTTSVGRCVVVSVTTEPRGEFARNFDIGEFNETLLSHSGFC